MLNSADEVPSGATLRDDVCIIGGGVAGLTLAAALSAAGRSVTLLECGGNDDEAARQDLSEGESVGQPYDQLASGRYRRLGGSSHLWNIDLGEGEVGPRLQPLRPLDFEAREPLRECGWPFDFREIEPYYRKAYEFLRLGTFPDDVGRWVDEHHPLLPLDRAVVETTLFRFLPRERFTGELPEELSASPSVRVLLHATVKELVARPGSAEVEAARVIVSPGHEFEVRARTFVLAAGTLENARLLLVSRSAQPTGLGNQHDLVGRYFMEHPHFCAGWMLPRDPALLGRLGLYRLHRNAGRPVMAKLRLSEGALRSEALLDFCVGLKPMWRAVPTRSVKALTSLKGSGRPNRIKELPVALWEAAADLPGIVRYAGQRLKERTGRPLQPNVVKLNAMTEQAPGRDSRMTLSENRDALGQQRVRLEWRLSRQDEESVRRATAILDEELRKSGLGRVVANEEPFDGVSGGWHHMGTTRMHTDPRKGVVDAHGRVHASPNLYLAGSSVFPTGGFANPTLTIVALALRLADHLVRRPAAVQLAPAETK